MVAPGAGPGSVGGYDAAVARAVLIVEDDPVILQLLEVNFEMEGFTVLTAADGDEGIRMAREHHPDVIITDIMMPRSSGLDLLRALRADPELADTPVVVVSAKAQIADVRAGLDAGADEYVTKPFEPLDLVDRVNALIEARERR